MYVILHYLPFSWSVISHCLLLSFIWYFPLSTSSHCQLFLMVCNVPLFTIYCGLSSSITRYSSFSVISLSFIPNCMSFLLYVILYYLAILPSLLFTIVCYYHLPDVLHCMPMPIICHSPLYVIPHYIVLSIVCQLALSVILHGLSFPYSLSFPIVCYLPLSVFLHHVVLLIVCHSELSVISHCPIVTSVCSSPLVALQVISPLSVIPHCLSFIRYHSQTVCRFPLSVIQLICLTLE